MHTIPTKWLTILRNHGYTGGDQIEDVMRFISLYLAERGLYHVSGDIHSDLTWWVKVKDDGMLAGKQLPEALVDKFISIFG